MEENLIYSLKELINRILKDILERPDKNKEEIDDDCDDCEIYNNAGSHCGICDDNSAIDMPIGESLDKTISEANEEKDEWHRIHIDFLLDLHNILKVNQIEGEVFK